MTKIHVNKGNEELKELFKNVYFINGTAYSGKSTMIRMLSEKYSPNSIMCGENYINDVMKSYKIDIYDQPNLCYFDTMKSWDEFINRTPEEYDNWIIGCSKESAPIEINEIIKYVTNNPDKKIFVDTNIPLDILHNISNHSNVLIMLCDSEISVNCFFDRPDEEKQFILKMIKKSSNPNALENYKNCLKKVNSKEHYEEFLNSGFNVLIRDNNRTLEETLNIVEEYFNLNEKRTIK